MDTNLVQSMVDVVFKGNLLYLSPIIFLLMAVLFADKIIEIIKKSVDGRSSTRRNHYG